MITCNQYTLGAEGFSPTRDDSDSAANLVMVFGPTEALKDDAQIGAIRAAWPDAILLGSSTAGEIKGNEAFTDALVVSAITFEHTKVKVAHVDASTFGSSDDAGRALAKALDHDGLAHVFILSKGLDVNGTALSAGLIDVLPEKVAVTGGLAGDGTAFGETWVICGETSSNDAIAALGFYGDRLKIGYGSQGGWCPFGPVRRITRSDDNVLFEIDGEDALGLYKTYLGEHAERLPASALLFPLMVTRNDGERGIVRTILSVDDDKGSMLFAGDIPEGANAQLMMASTSNLVDGAAEAAERTKVGLGGSKAELILLVSCVGRRLVLRQNIEDELDAVQDVLGDVPMAGFYSYGELCPYEDGKPTELHNQTMTVTAFAEV